MSPGSQQATPGRGLELKKLPCLQTTHKPHCLQTMSHTAMSKGDSSPTLTVAGPWYKVGHLINIHVIPGIPSGQSFHC